MPSAIPATDSPVATFKQKKSIVWWLILLCAPVICLMVYYTPWLMSLGWHATHGMNVNYRGLKVHVPMGWTGVTNAGQEDFTENPQGVTLEKQPKTLGFDSQGPEMMYFNLLLPDPKVTVSEQIAQWQDIFRQAHPPSSFDLDTPAGVPAGMECIQATPHEHRSAAALACVSSTGGWLAQFAGSQAQVPLFLNIASRLNSKRDNRQ